MKNPITILGILFLTVLAGCGPAKNSTADILTGSTWELASINGKAVDAANYPKGLPYIKFTTDNKVNGNSGCNGFGGSYNLNEDNGISVSQVISTKMYCEGVDENSFFSALRSVNMVKADMDKLVLMQDTESKMEFVPRKDMN